MAVDDLYIPDGVFLKCDQGTTITNLQVNFKKHKLYGEIIATEIDNLPITNIPCFGACSSSGSACIPKTPEWKNIHEGGTKVEGQKPLLITSYCKCMQGGNIDIFFDEESALAELESDKENRVDKNMWIDAPLGFIMIPIAKITGSDYSDMGRGLRQGGKKSWNGIVQMVSHFQDTFAGLGKLVGTGIIGYMPPMTSEFPSTYEIEMQQQWMNTTAEERIAAFDKDMGTDLTSTHEGIKKAGSEFWDRKIENGTQVERGVLAGEAVEFVAELVVGSKGVGAALKTTSQGAKAAITAVRGSAAFANVSEKTAVAIATVNKFVQASKLGNLAKSIKGVFKVGRKKVIFELDLEKHIKFRDMNVPRKRGIGGAHNLEEFMKYSDEFKIVNITEHPTIPGVKHIEYQMTTLDKFGKPTGGYNSKIFEKTVYDPSIISDSKMAQLGREAAEQANKAGTLTREWSGIANDGTKMRGYLNDAGEVRSYFVDFVE